MKVTAELRQQFRERAQETVEVPAEKRVAKLNEIRLALKAELNKSVEKNLKKPQRDRLEQIRLQNRGIEALLEPEVGSKLKLTDEQKTKIAELAEESRRKMIEMSRGLASEDGDREAAMKKMASLRKETMELCLDELSDDQKKIWKGLKGERFEVDLRGRRSN
jgi:hypothetical protein